MSKSSFILLVVGKGILSLLSHPVDFFVLCLFQFQQDVLARLEFPFLFGKFLLFQLNLDGFILQHVTLHLGHLDLFPLELVFSLTKRALHDLSNVNGALLDPFQNCTELMLLV